MLKLTRISPNSRRNLLRPLRSTSPNSLLSRKRMASISINHVKVVLSFPTKRRNRAMMRMSSIILLKKRKESMEIREAGSVEAEVAEVAIKVKIDLIELRDSKPKEIQRNPDSLRETRRRVITNKGNRRPKRSKHLYRSKRLSLTLLLKKPNSRDGEASNSEKQASIIVQTNSLKFQLSI